jgi:hypothetical protein
VDPGIRDRARIPRYAVIPTNGRACLKDCLEAIVPQVHSTVLIHTVPDSMTRALEMIEAMPAPQGVGGICHIEVTRPQVNISWWWNLGLNYWATEAHTPKWDVAILNDDVIVPEGWFDAVSGTMRTMQVAAGCSGGQGPMPVLQTVPGPVGLQNRLQGFAFILAGELGLRANEEIRWHFSDDYIDYESRKLGGMVMVPGYHVRHLHPDQQVSPAMSIMCAEDAQKFHDLYNGAMPW